MLESVFLNLTARFQTAMRPAVPAVEIDKISRELEKFASEFGEIIVPENIPRYYIKDKNVLYILKLTVFLHIFIMFTLKTVANNIFLR